MKRATATGDKQIRWVGSREGKVPEEETQDCFSQTHIEKTDTCLVALKGKERGKKGTGLSKTTATSWLNGDRQFWSPGPANSFCSISRRGMLSGYWPV